MFQASTNGTPNEGPNNNGNAHPSLRDGVKLQEGFHPVGRPDSNPDGNARNDDQGSTEQPIGE